MLVRTSSPVVLLRERVMAQHSTRTDVCYMGTSSKRHGGASCCSIEKGVTAPAERLRRALKLHWHPTPFVLASFLPHMAHPAPLCINMEGAAADHPSQQPFRFFDLPREMRDAIYEESKIDIKAGMRLLSACLSYLFPSPLTKI